MAKCPNCKSEVAKPSKKWKYRHFVVELFDCSSCGTRFREYSTNGTLRFTLKLKKGKGYVKA